jgi:hypothetical protein
VAEIEGENDDDMSSEDELGDAFASLLVDTEEEEVGKQHTDSYFTSVESFFSTELSIVSYTIPYVKTLVDDLNNQALVHQLTAQLPSGQMDNLTDNSTDNLTVDFADSFTTGNASRYDSRHFYGVVIDTGASQYSTAGYEQFQALQRTNSSITLNETTKGQVKVRFGIGSTSSIGSTKVETPIGQVEFHIMTANTPFLLSLADMDKLGVYFNNLTNSLVTSTGNSVLVVRRFGHSFLLWDTSLQSFIAESFAYNPCYLTEVELQRLHRRFGHPSVSRL